MRCGKTNVLFIGIIAVPLLIQTYQGPLSAAIPARMQPLVTAASRASNRATSRIVPLKPCVSAREIRRFCGVLRKKIILAKKGRTTPVVSFRTQVYFFPQTPDADNKKNVSDWRVDVEILL